MNKIQETRENLITFFESVVRPYITEDNKDMEDLFLDLCSKHNSKLKYIAKWYNNTIRISAYSNGLSMQYFMTGTIPGKEAYVFDGPGPSINEV